MRRGRGRRGEIKRAERKDEGKRRGKGKGTEEREGKEREADNLR